MLAVILVPDQQEPTVPRVEEGGDHLPVPRRLDNRHHPRFHESPAYPEGSPGRLFRRGDGHRSRLPVNDQDGTGKQLATDEPVRPEALEGVGVRHQGPESPERQRGARESQPVQDGHPVFRPVVVHVRHHLAERVLQPQFPGYLPGEGAVERPRVKNHPPGRPVHLHRHHHLPADQLVGESPRELLGQQTGQEEKRQTKYQQRNLHHYPSFLLYQCIRGNHGLVGVHDSLGQAQLVKQVYILFQISTCKEHFLDFHSFPARHVLVQ